LKNSSYKKILFTAYSAGLRVGEVAALNIKDVDGDKMPEQTGACYPTNSI